MSCLARISNCAHSLNSAAAYNGVSAFTATSRGTASPAPLGGASSVNLGSSPRKAERRNLKPQEETKVSAMQRMAAFSSCLSNFRSTFPSNFCRNSSGGTETTSSMSGTATLKARLPSNSPLTKPQTSASGKSGWMALFTVSTSRCAAFSDSLLGVICDSSSCTSASQHCPGNAGGHALLTFGAMRRAGAALDFLRGHHVS
mmetsp:Transcript_64283/g.140929  ORF Transcript_64283/g.140929 Transcript_64283/m.140929 type:complete len:201 (+) Transcript_64283:676-1278(+)